MLQRKSPAVFISNGMNKLLILALIFFVGFVPFALAQGFVPIAEIKDLTSPEVANSENLAIFFNNLYKYLIGLSAALAVIMIIWGGLEISTKDSVSKQSDGKERITQAIFGLVLVLSPVLVFSIINPSILNLSLNLPKLDTKSSTPVQIAPTQPKPKPGCNDPSLTSEEQKACTSAQNVIGTNPSSPASNEDIRYYFNGGSEVYKQTLANQVKTCNDGGGTVSGNSLYIDKSSSSCSTAGEKYAKSHSYTGCKLLVSNTSVCFSK